MDEFLLLAVPFVFGLLCNFLMTAIFFSFASFFLWQKCKKHSYLGVLAHRSRVIERPIGLNAPFWISSHGISARFLSGMARFIAQLYLNVMPSTVTASQQELLKYTAPNAYDAVKRVLVQMQADINKEDLTSLFIMGELKINTAQLETKITGELILKSGDTNTVTTHKIFVLTFINADRQLLLAGLRELHA